MVNRFKLKQLQKHQEAIIKECLMGKDCFFIIATGGGKSLCYQPTALLSPAVTVVISPLKSLIVDQLNRLNDLKVYFLFFFSFDSFLVVYFPNSMLRFQLHTFLLLRTKENN